MTQQTCYSIQLLNDEIHSLVRGRRHSKGDVHRILHSARDGKGLSLEEAAVLLNETDPHLLHALYDAANAVKEKIFGKRIVLFAPLYISNHCMNNCLYCGFRRDNQEAERKHLTIPEIVRQAGHLFDKGYRRLLLVAGEDTRASSLDYLCEAVEAIYRGTGVRIVHVNAAPMTGEAFSQLKAAGVGVYQCFQETYHRETYDRMHPLGPKHDYDWRLSAMDRAVAGGFDDLGVGALLGLYDFRFEALSLIAHARFLEEKYGVGPHTISVPRLRPASGAALTHPPSPVSDEDFMKVVAVYRLAVPYSGVVVSTREGADLRDHVIHQGASQISAGSRTDVGGYAGPFKDLGTSQFSLNDPRSLEEVIRSIMESGLLPSLCTSCYRSGRTGERFRAAAEKGEIKDLCLANALLSLMEYLEQHPAKETRSLGLSAIGKSLSRIRNPVLRQSLEQGLERISHGDDDVHL